MPTVMSFKLMSIELTTIHQKSPCNTTLVYLYPDKIKLKAVKISQ